MATTKLRSAAIWALADRQRGVLARRQLLDAGLSASAIRHRQATGRLHAVRRGVYAVGRPGLTREGELMAAVLACGEGAVLSHRAAGEHFGLLARRADPIDITVPATRRASQRGIRTHGRNLLTQDTTTYRDIPLTAPPCTLVDLATVLTERELEAAVNQADKLDLVDPPTLRLAIREMPPRAGKPALASLLDRDTSHAH
jgi:hypothetical protein